jgi:hypothetical protein
MRRIVLTFLLPASVLSAAAQAQAEPDGSRANSAVSSFSGEPAPPAWLRTVSHAAALVDTRHYLYEVYGASDAAGAQAMQWIVRYVMLPEGSEAYREIEQIFLFDANPKHKPKELKPSEITVDPQEVTWKKAKYKLVDRRDLLLP